MAQPSAEEETSDSTSIFQALPLFGKYGYHLLMGAVVLLLTQYIVLRYMSRSSKTKAGKRRNAYVNEKTAEVNVDENDDEDDPDLNGPIFDALRDVKHIKHRWTRMSNEKMIYRSEDYYNLMNQRRTIRHFSSEPVPREVIDKCILTAGTSPSGAHMQPWTYVIVTSPEIKNKLREIVEREEEVNYKRRMGSQWVDALKPFKTSWIKEYITEVPYIILVFKTAYSLKPDGTKQVHYYSELSLSISVGILLTAIHYSGLHTLTSTPLNCGPAISALLGRPANEKLVFLLPVGFPGADCHVPDLKRKPLEEIAIYV